MAKTKTVEYTLSLDDLATSVYEKFVNAVQSGEVDVTKALNRGSGAFAEHGRAIQGVTGWIREQRAQNRENNFFIQQGRDAVNAAGLAMNIYAGTLGAGNTRMKEMVGVVNTGIVAFQGLNAISSLLPGPWSMIISVAGGLVASFIAMNDKADKNSDVIRSNKAAIDALVGSYDAWQEKLKGTTDSMGNFTKAQVDLTQKNAQILQTQINKYREYLDEVVNGEKVQIQLFGLTQQTRKTGIESLSSINRKFLQESQTFQVAYNNAIAEGKSKEEAKTDAIKAAKEELQGMIDRQNAYIASLASTQAVGATTTGTLGAMRLELERINQEMEKVTPGGDQFTKLREQADKLKVAIHDIEEPPKSTFLFTFGYELQKSFDAGAEAVKKFKESQKTLFGSGPSEETKVQLAIEVDVQRMERSLMTERQMIDEWEASIVESATATEEQKTRATQIAARRRAQIELQSNQQTFRQVAQLAQQAFNIIGKFGSQAAEGRLIEIQTEKDAQLAAIDEKLNAEGLSEEQRKVLLAERDKVQQSFEARERSAKQEMFAAEKSAAVIQSIIQTAMAVVEALPNIPLAIAVGVLGAAQTALIAGQPTPKFHEGSGGPIYFDAPPSREFGLKVRGGETFEVKTEAQQRSSGGGFTLIINGPIASKKAFKDIVQEGMRDLGITDVREYFRNNRAGIQEA